MPESMIRDKLIKEIELFPDEKLSELYDFVHYFRLGFQKATSNPVDEIMKFAGCWEDMPEEEFQEFSEEIVERRQKAFSRRRKSESDLD